MKGMTSMRTVLICFSSVLTAMIASACGEGAQTADQLNRERRTPGAGMSPAMSLQPQPGPQVQGGPQPQASAGDPPQEGAPTNSEVPNVSQLAPPAAGEPGGAGSPMAGPGGGMMAEGSMEPVAADPSAPRSGRFKMLVYSRTTGFRHDSIPQGKTMLQQIASEQDFEITETETNELITLEGLSQFEIVFFMNSTGDIFNDTEQTAFQEWMETRNGAMAGVHSATDTEQGWAFYKEVTGQYYDGHVNANTPGAIQMEADMLQFPALIGVPNPWQRNEEWYRFNSFQEWSSKEGFKILGRKQADNQPIMWIREFDGWRSFYTAIGHDAAVFRDPVVKQHLTGGIMWAVRRDQLLP
jgi:uncharacterized protein